MSDQNWCEIAIKKKDNGYKSVIISRNLKGEFHEIQGAYAIISGKVYRWFSEKEYIYLANENHLFASFELEDEEAMTLLEETKVLSTIERAGVHEIISGQKIYTNSETRKNLYKDYISDFTNKITLLGAIPGYLLCKEHTYGYSGGAHGWEYSQFVLINLESQSTEDPPEDEYLSNIVNDTYNDWKDDLVERSFFFESHDKKSIINDASITLSYPTILDNEISYNYQITLDACYASSDGGWGDYSVSKVVKSKKKSGIYRRLKEYPTLLYKNYSKICDDYDIVGWTSGYLTMQELKTLINFKESS